MSSVKKQPKQDKIVPKEPTKPPAESQATPNEAKCEQRLVIDDETGNELRELENSINNMQQHYRTRLALYRRLNKFPDFPKTPLIPDPVRLEFDQALGKYVLVWTKEEKKPK